MSPIIFKYLIQKELKQVHDAQFSRNTDFFYNQKPRNSSTLCIFQKMLIARVFAFVISLKGDLYDRYDCNSHLSLFIMFADTDTWPIMLSTVKFLSGKQEVRSEVTLFYGF